MLYRLAIVDAVDPNAKELALEGLFTKREVTQIKKRYYGRSDTTDVIVAKRARVTMADIREMVSK